MGAAEYDVTAYDAGDMSSMSSILSVPAPTPAAGVPSVASATRAATTEAESKAPAPVTDAASAADAAAAVDAPAAETTPQGSNAATDTPTAASAEPASPPGNGAALGTEAETPSAGGAGERPSRAAMQTGSVNVLFPQRVAGPDEAAAAALAGAFGGPSPRAESPVVGRAARPAAQELSLDRVFRETAAPIEPRREAGAFSFDQFFGDTPPGLQPGAPPAPDAAAPSEASDVTSADAEQFSSWLSGLKKK
jgi:Meckel syndrome type 1 protein